MSLPPTGLEGLHPDFIDPVESPCVFTTMRWDKMLLDSPANSAASCNSASPVYLFEHHWTRLQVAKWGTSWYNEDAVPARARSPAHLLHTVSTAAHHWQHGRADSPALRIKLRCYVGGKMSVEINPLERLPIQRLFPADFDDSRRADSGPTFTIMLDTRPTEPTELTMYKTSRRESYARARSEAGIGSLSDPQEVLLYGPQGAIFDGSISTPYFYRAGRWVTPSSSSGGQQGVTRRWALENHLAVEDVISVDSLVDGELMWLSNAVKGYFPAVFQKSSTKSQVEDLDGSEMQS